MLTACLAFFLFLLLIASYEGYRCVLVILPGQSVSFFPSISSYRADISAFREPWESFKGSLLESVDLMVPKRSLWRLVPMVCL
jgi:hypothetical protein